MDDDSYWKLSKKQLELEVSSICGSSLKSHIPRSFSTKMMSTGSSSSSSSSSSTNYYSPAVLMRSCSTRTSTTNNSSSGSNKSSSSSSSSSSLLPRSVSQKSSNITRKCTNLAKEQKARFYIMKRCITMLVCWNKHGNS